MAAKKAAKAQHPLSKPNLLLAVVVSLFVGVVGTYAITRGHAAAYPGYFFPDSNNQYTSSPYNPRYMGNTVSFRGHYKNSNKAPVAKITCWHVDVSPSFAYYDSGDSALESKARATTAPIFSKTLSPAPASDQTVLIQLGTSGTGPATCDSQLFDGTTLLSTITFRSL